MAITMPTATTWDNVLELTKISQDKGNDPFQWAIQLCGSLNLSGVSLPSCELAHVLVSHICWGNNVPMAWKYLEKALVANLVPPMLVLAFLSTRVTPSRRLRPEAYRLYLELLKRHGFSFASQIKGPCCQKILMSIDEALNLSQTFGIQACEPGVLVVEFVFSIVCQLLDATLEDEGLQELGQEKKFRWTTGQQDMQIDGEENHNEKKTQHREKLQKVNTMMAIELIGQFLQHKITSRLINLACQNMPLHRESFSQSLLLLQARSAAFRSSISPGTMMHLSSYMCTNLGQEFQPDQLTATRAIISSCSLTSTVGNCCGASQSAIWIPLDLFMEDAMDGSQVAATCAFEIVSDLTKYLKAVNGTTWHETFLGLWMASLRLVQRERDPVEGPVPRLDARLCLLLSITTLAIADIIEEEEVLLINDAERNQRKEKPVVGKRRKDLISSLQVLGDFEGLLVPPQSVTSVANQAAAKAMMFVSGLAVGNVYMESISMNDVPMNCYGNMRHLIVEACIARNLLDTSAYFWPGYVSGRINQFPHNIPGQVPGWPALMKGAPLSTLMINTLATTPASRCCL